MAYKNVNRLMEEVDGMLAGMGLPFSVYDMPDYTWADYDDASEALYDAASYWYNMRDIPRDFYNIIMDVVD